MAIKDGIRVWRRIQEVNAVNARRSIAQSIRGRASMIAPKLTGVLRQNGRVEEVSKDKSRIIFGDANVPYARRRNFENKKNPQTKDYLKKAGDGVTKEPVGKWLK